MDFTLRELQAFIEVARHGNFTRAAQVLNMSQPAVTVRVRHLEDALDVRLLDRTTRSVALTRAGRHFLPVVEHVLHEITAVADSARDRAASERGLVTVATIPSIAATVLPAVLAAFHARHPDIVVRVRDGVVGQSVPSLVKSGEADLGIGTPTKHDAALRITPLMMDPLGAVFPAGHALERRRSVRPEDLAALPLILMDREYTVRTLIDGAFESIHRAVSPAYEVAYVSTALGLVRAGLGVAIVALSAAAQAAVEAAGLQARIIDRPTLIRHIALIQSTRRSLSDAATDFASAVFASCKRPTSPVAFGAASRRRARLHAASGARRHAPAV